MTLDQLDKHYHYCIAQSNLWSERAEEVAQAYTALKKVLWKKRPRTRKEK